MRIRPYELQEIWDIGAHKGETTLKFAGDFPTALIRSFEPVSENYYSLRNNCSHLKNQSSHNIALGEENKKTKIFLQGASVIHYLRNDLNKPSAKDPKSEDIEVKTVDHVINDFKTASIDLLKIDVEGFELDVLIGLKKIIKKSRPLLLIEIEKRHNRNYLKVFKLLKNTGYKIYYLDKNEFILKSLLYKNINYFFKKKQNKRVSKNYVNNFFCEYIKS